jgi:hypothetical protein
MNIILTIVIMCLAAALVISVITITNLLDRNNTLQKEVDSAKREVETSKKPVKKEEDIFDIMPGDTGIIKNYGIVNTNPNRNPVKIEYTVTYEVTILEVSKDSVKVTATDFSSFDPYARDSANRTKIIDFMTDKWIDKSKVEIVVDQKKIRDIKLSELGL